MSSTVSFRILPASLNFVARPRNAPTAVASPTGLGRLLTEMRRRRLDRRIAKALERLDHTGLIEDFQQAARG
jgi:hypothetical protein